MSLENVITVFMVSRVWPLGSAMTDTLIFCPTEYEVLLPVEKYKTAFCSAKAKDGTISDKRTPAKMIFFIFKNIIIGNPSRLPSLRGAKQSPYTTMRLPRRPLAPRNDDDG